MSEYTDVVDRTEKYLDLIPGHLRGDSANDLVRLLADNLALLKKYHDALESMQAPLPEEIEQFCKELSWFRGCDDWELDEFLIEINKDRQKATDLIERLARHNSIQSETLRLSLKNESDLEQRIEELEALVHVLRFANDEYSEKGLKEYFENNGD